MKMKTTMRCYFVPTKMTAIKTAQSQVWSNRNPVPWQEERSKGSATLETLGEVLIKLKVHLL
jgi:hypothetical protein